MMMIQHVDLSSFMNCFYISIFMCNALVSFIIKATVSAPCEPCMSCRSVLLHYCSHVYVKLLFDK